MTNKRNLLLTAAIIAAFAGSLQAEPVDVSAKGKNLETAADNAGVAAVRVTMKSILSPEELRANSREIVKTVIRPWKQFVRGTTLKSQKEEGRFAYVEATVDVDRDALTAALAGIPTLAEKSLAAAKPVQSAPTTAEPVTAPALTAQTETAHPSVAAWKLPEVPQVASPAPRTFDLTPLKVTKSANAMGDEAFIALFLNPDTKLEAIEAALLQGANPNAVEQVDYYKPLFFAIGGRNGEDWLQRKILLVRAGANLKWRDPEHPDYSTFEHLAERGADLATWQLIHQAESTFLEELKKGTIIHGAVSEMRGGCSADVIRYFLDLLGNDAKAVLSRPSLDGNSILTDSAGRDDQGAVTNMLLKAGADPNLYFEERLPLENALFCHKDEAFELLLEAGANPNFIDPLSSRPLIYETVSRPNPRALRALIVHGVDLNAMPNNKEPILNVAVRALKSDNEKIPEIIAILLEAGVDPIKTDAKGLCAYDHLRENAPQNILALFPDQARIQKHLAQIEKYKQDGLFYSEVREGEITGEAIIKKLAEGANPNAHAWDDDQSIVSPETVLYAYLRNNRDKSDPTVVAAFLKAGADPQALSVIKTAFENGNREIIETILHSRPDWSAVDGLPKGILDCWVENCGNKPELTDTLKIILSKGVNPMASHPAELGKKIIADTDNPAIFNLLATAGYNPNIRDERNRALVYSAAYKAKPVMFKALLDIGADVNMLSGDLVNMPPEAIKALGQVKVKGLPPDIAALTEGKPRGDTALMAAVDMKSAETVKMILDAGGDPNIQDKEGYTALYHALDEGKDDVIKLLLAAKFEPNIYMTRRYPTVMHKAFAEKKFYALDRFLNMEGINLNIPDRNGATQFFYLVTVGSADQIKKALAAGAEPNGKADGIPTLFMAAANGDTEVLKIMQKASGYDIRTRMPEKGCGAELRGATILQFTLFSPDGYKNMKYLVDEGIDINAPNLEGNTPLHIAADTSNTNAVKTLLELGADRTLKNKDGKLPVELAPKSMKALFQ